MNSHTIDYNLDDLTYNYPTLILLSSDFGFNENPIQWDIYLISYRTDINLEMSEYEIKHAKGKSSIIGEAP